MCVFLIICFFLSLSLSLIQYKAIVLVALIAAVNCATFGQRQVYQNQYQNQFQQSRYQQQLYQQQLQQQQLQAQQLQQQQAQEQQLRQQQLAEQYRQNRVYQSGADAAAQVLRSDSTVEPDSFQYAYETSNGIAGQQSGQLRQVGAEAAVVSQGQFSYTSPEGEKVSLSFVADENGYQPTGSHIPTPPPIPEAIQRSIDYILRVNPQLQANYQRRF